MFTEPTNFQTNENQDHIFTGVDIENYLTGNSFIDDKIISRF